MKPVRRKRGEDFDGLIRRFKKRYLPPRSSQNTESIQYICHLDKSAAQSTMLQ